MAGSVRLGVPGPETGRSPGQNHQAERREGGFGFAGRSCVFTLIRPGRNWKSKIHRRQSSFASATEDIHLRPVMVDRGAMQGRLRMNGIKFVSISAIRVKGLFVFSALLCVLCASALRLFGTTHLRMRYDAARDEN